MSERPLPQDGADRDIFVVGLRRLSDSCEMPELTPECPFYEITVEGPQCAEQCIDLLADHGGGRRQLRQELGGGLAAVRRPSPPRPRRSPEPDARPF